MNVDEKELIAILENMREKYDLTIKEDMALVIMIAYLEELIEGNV